MSLIPMAFFGLEVPPGAIIQASGEIPAAYRISMAALDLDADPEGDEGAPQRATLRILRQPMVLEDSDDDSEEFDADEMERILAENDSEDEEDDELENGGPSDPAKSKKARKAAAEKEIKKLLNGDSMDVDEKKTNGVNGVSKKSKGKMPASDEDEDDDDEEDSDEDSDGEVEEFVICTLDPQKNYNQPLDLTIGEDERVWFKVTGTHSIFLTGNYVEPTDDHSHEHGMGDDSEDEYDMEPDEDELDEEDELDDMSDPRIMEVEEEEAPKLIAAATQKKAKPAAEEKKAGNKRAAPEEDVSMTLDDMITGESKKAESTEAESKLSKKQLKKLKKNDGTAAATKAEEKSEAPSSAKSDKKVSFAKNLEQGPTASPTPAKDAAADKDKPKAATGPRVVQGVTIDDKKLGTGAAAKNGDRIGMRYIGKLQKDGKVFDSNKKGKPFSFKLGQGEVIKGWEIGVKGMSIGGERRLTIPAALAYGSKGAGGDIPPNATLIFDIKCLEINK